MPMLPSIAGEKLKKDEKEVTLTTISCQACKHEASREYREGDIVFGEAKDPCPSCSGGPVMVSSIFVDVVKK